MLHIIYSNRYEALKQCLIANLNQERLLNEDPVFSPLRIIVPGDVVTEDLMRTIADHPDSKGLCTGVKMLQISRWMEPYGSLWLGNSDLGIELEWVIWRILQDDAFTARHPRLQQYLRTQRKSGVYELAVRIAKVFTKYINYRYDWVLEWLLGKDALLEKKIILDSDRRQEEIVQRDGLIDAQWQKELWQAIKQKMAEDQQYLAETGGFQATTLIDLLEGIPDRFEQNRADPDAEESSDSLHFFLPKTLPPMALPFLAEESRKRDLWLYLMNPCSTFWFESLPKNLFNDWTESPENANNAFLHRNGASTRALIDRIWRFAPDDGEIPLIEDEIQKERKWNGVQQARKAVPWANLTYTTYYDFAKAQGGERHGIDQHMFYIERPETTLLDKIANSILKDEPLKVESFNPSEDHSLRIVKASGLVRQIEGVADWIQTIRHETELSADEILVVMPDIDKAAPLIEGVMDALPESARIDYTIVGRSGLVANMAAQGIIKAGKMLHANMGAESFFALLAHPLMTASWDITLDDVQILRRWLETAGFRYGLNEMHIGALASENKVVPEQNGSDGTLTRAIERLVLGHMTAEGDYQPYGDVLPVYGKENSGFDSVSDGSGRIEVLVNIFTAFEKAFGGMVAESSDGSLAFQDKDADGWYQWTLELIEQLFPNTPSQKPYVEEIAEFRQVLVKQIALIRRSLQSGGEMQQGLSFEVFWQALENGLVENRDNIRGSGKVTFAGMQDFRWLPYKAIAMIGMDDGPVFPGVNRGEEFDLTQPIGVNQNDIIKRRGDRDARGDNRNIFLDLLLAAQEYLLITYNAGTDPESKTPLNPSIVVQDLVFWLKESGVASDSIVTVMPLTRYSEGNLFQTMPEGDFDDGRDVRFFRTFDERVKGAVEQANAEGYHGRESAFLAGAAPISSLTEVTALPFADLEGLWARPDSYLRKKVRMADTENIEQDRIPQVTMPDDRLFESSLERRMLEICEQGEELDKLLLDPRLGSQDIRGILMEPMTGKVSEIYEAAQGLNIDSTLNLPAVTVQFDGRPLQLQIPALQHCQGGTYGQEGYAVTALTGSTERRALILHLLVSASEHPLPLYVVSWNKEGILIKRYYPCPAEEAVKVLTAMCQLYQVVMNVAAPVFPNKFDKHQGGIPKPKFNPIWRHDESLQSAQNDLKKDIDDVLMSSFFESQVVLGTEKKTKKGEESVTADAIVERIQKLMLAELEEETEND